VGRSLSVLSEEVMKRVSNLSKDKFNLCNKRATSRPPHRAHLAKEICGLIIESKKFVVGRRLFRCKGLN